MDLWYTITAFEYSVWIGCAVFYVIDHFIFLNPQELLYEEKPSGTWRFRINSIPFLIFKKELCVIRPYFPWLCSLKLSWGKNLFPSERTVRSERRDLLIFLKSSSELRLVSLISFISLFALGPYLTATKGLTHAILTVALLNVLLQVCSLLTLWSRHKNLKVSKLKILLLMLEGLVCPPYTACLLKRISLHYAVSCDGLIFGKDFHKTVNFPAVLEHAAIRLQDLSQVGSLPEGNELVTEKYLAKLRLC